MAPNVRWESTINLGILWLITHSDTSLGRGENWSLSEQSESHDSSTLNLNKGTQGKPQLRNMGSSCCDKTPQLKTTYERVYLGLSFQRYESTVGREVGASSGSHGGKNKELRSFNGTSTQRVQTQQLLQGHASSIFPNSTTNWDQVFKLLSLGDFSPKLPHTGSSIPCYTHLSSPTFTSLYPR